MLAAEEHARSMQRVSLMLKHKDTWNVVIEEEKTDKKDPLMLAKEKRAAERKARLDAEIAKSYRQYQQQRKRR